MYITEFLLFNFCVCCGDYVSRQVIIIPTVNHFMQTCFKMVTIDDFNQQRPIDTAELTFDNANKNNDHCLFLDIVILNGQLKTKQHDKTDDFSFFIVNYLLSVWDVTSSWSYSVNISIIIEFARLYHNVYDLN